MFAKNVSVREGLPEQELSKSPPPPYPNPGTLVDLTTKARKCDSRHFDVKSASMTIFGSE